MRRNETGRRVVGGRVSLAGGLLIAALAFSAGVLGARSHRPENRQDAAPAVRIETSSVAQTDAMEPRWASSSDSAGPNRRIPGHSELDLQLD